MRPTLLATVPIAKLVVLLSCAVMVKLPLVVRLPLFAPVVLAMIPRLDEVLLEYRARDASLYARRNDGVDFADKIIELLDDPERRQRMGEYGRHRVLHELEWKYEAPKLLAAYDEAFGAGNAALPSRVPGSR